MSIDFEWEFGDEEQRSQPEQTTTAGSGPPVWRLLLPVLAVIAGIAALWVAYTLRDRNVETSREEALAAAVFAETSALRQGDEMSFMAMQGGTDVWRRAQRANFEDYASGEVVATGEVIEQQIEDDAARVVLEEIVEGEPRQTTWFYLFEEGRWYRTPFSRGLWGTVPRLETEYFRIINSEELPIDTADLDSQMAAICGVVACPEEQYTIVLAPMDGLRLGWLPVTEALVLEPAHVGGHGTYIIEDVQAEAVQDYWLQMLLGDAYEPDEITWIRHEIDLWMAHHAHGAPLDERDIPVIRSMEMLYGDDFVPALIEAMRQGSAADEVMTRVVADALTAENVATDPAATFELALRAEMTAYMRGSHTYRLERFFLHPDDVGQGLDTDRSSRVLYDASELRSFEVVDVVPYNDLYLVQFEAERPDYGGDAWPNMGLSGWIVFEQWAGRWWRIHASEEELGGMVISAGPGDAFFVEHLALDEDFAVDVLQTLTTTLEQTRMDFGIEQPPRVRVRLLYGWDTYADERFGDDRADVNLPNYPDWSSAVTVVYISPFAEIRPADPEGAAVVDEWMLYSIAWQAVRGTLMERFPEEAPSHLVSHLADYQMARLDLPADYLWGEPSPSELPPVELAPTLGALWAGSGSSLESRNAHYIAWLALFDLLVATEGEEVLARMRTANSWDPSAWLLSLLEDEDGSELAQFNSDWRLCTLAILGDEDWARELLRAGGTDFQPGSIAARCLSEG